MKTLTTCAVALSLMGVCNSARAQADNPANQLLESVMNERSEPTERLRSLDELARLDVRIYVEALRGLAQSDDERFAQYATEQLVALIAMTGGHEMRNMAGAPDDDTRLVERVVEILREQVDHPSRAVRERALVYLVGRDDPEAIKAMEGLRAAGTISEEEALRYYMAGGSEETVTKLREYAEGADPELARRAVSFLSADTNQQAYVRERILANDAVQKIARGAALENLAKYDEGFATYAADPKIVRFALEVDQLPGAPQKSGADVLVESLKQSIEANPGLQDYIGGQLNESVETFRSQGESDKLLILEQSILQKMQ